MRCCLPPPTNCDGYIANIGGDDNAHSTTIFAGVGAVMKGFQLIKFVSYSHTKKLPKRQRIVSDHFRLGGHTWFVVYYPNGDRAGNVGFVSLFLGLHAAAPGPVKANVTASLLNQDGLITSYSKELGRFAGFKEKQVLGFPCFIKRKALEKSRYQYLNDDSFTVRFDVAIMGTQTITMPTPPQSDMHRHYGDLLRSKEGADVKFRVGTTTFSAHRLILSTRSPVFKAELFGPMKESSTTNAIGIPDMEPEVFDALLTFIYTDTLPETKQDEECAMAQHLLVAADRYNLERLKFICQHKLCNYIHTGSAATILALAERHNCHVLKDACFAFLSSPNTLDAVMKTDGFDYLTVSCPGVLKQLLSKFVPR